MKYTSALCLLVGCLLLSSFDKEKIKGKVKRIDTYCRSVQGSKFQLPETHDVSFYDSKGNKVEWRYGKDTNPLKHKYRYNSDNNITEATSYDEMDTLLTMEVYTYLDTFLTGRRSFIKGMLTWETIYERDDRGRATKEIHLEHYNSKTDTTAVTTYTYQPDGRISGYRTVIRGTTATVATYSYGKNDQTVEMTEYNIHESGPGDVKSVSKLVTDYDEKVLEFSSYHDNNTPGSHSRYIYEDYDKSGNWLKKQIMRNNVKEQEVARVIEYY